MATVYVEKRKRKNRNSYIVYYKDPVTLKSKYYKTYRRLIDANHAAHELRSLIDNGKIIKIKENKRKIKTLTFHEVSEYLKEEWNKRLSNGNLRIKTVEEYINLLNKINEIFGKIWIFEISEKDILEFREKEALKNSNISSNRKLFIIKQIFKKGIEISAVFKDPVGEIKYLSEKDHERNRFLMPEEINKLVKASKKTRAKFYMPALIYLGAEHGASRQESLSLKWSDIDFDYGETGIIRFFRTKNKRERTEFLMPRTRQALIEWRDHLIRKRAKLKIENIESLFVFCRINGEPIKRFDSAWRNACEVAGLKDFHFHDLRHTFCSNLLLAGSDLKDVKEMIGHSDIAMTDRYSHLTIRHKQIQQDKLSTHYSLNSGLKNEEE